MQEITPPCFTTIPSARRRISSLLVRVKSLRRCQCVTPAPIESPAAWLRLLPVGLAVCAAWYAAAVHAAFTDVSGDAELTHRQFTSASQPEQPQTYMTGGAAAGDFDNDGWIDLYFTRLDDSDILYRNRGDGSFEDVTEIAFGQSHLANVQTNGAAWGDIDNDGDLDLYVTSVFSSGYHLYVNDGSGVFSEQAAARGVQISGPDEKFGFSPSFGDFDRDGYIDLYVTEWRSRSQNPTESLQNSRLLRNQGESAPGHFVDVTQPAGVDVDHLVPLIPSLDSQTFTGRFSDLDQDGYPDLAITSDHGTSRLFWNNGDGTFDDGTDAAGVGTDQFGMGNAVGDFDGDGDLDWFVTSIYKEDHIHFSGNRLYRNEGGRLFTDATDAAGVRDGAWGWGAALVDFDNDGDLDIAEANGQHFDYPGASSVSVGFEANPVRFWENDGSGVMTENAALLGLTDTGRGKGLLTFDYDRDGDQDLLIVNNGDPPVLYRNDGDGQNDWLLVDLEGTRSNRQGLGALITVDPDQSTAGDELIREIDGGTHFLGQSPAVAHFGLGDRPADHVDQVTIRWPSGLTSQLDDVVVNSLLTAAEPSADFDNDQDVDGYDFLMWQMAFPDGGAAAAGDSDGDGDADAIDLANWQWGVGDSWQSAAATPVPEPASLLVMAMLSAVVLRLRVTC